ncbi:hypothetical protein [Horticoccus sp. 23ND18S-11]|uniref:hypothetical protein n=1 Tax=Horticoccus sp. 23ND18S-11 TaxID=3391832 RepID=UPI0039C9DD60
MKLSPAILSLLFSGVVCAQVAPVAPPAGPAAGAARPSLKPEDTIVLTPFTVNTDRDNGFAAANAGTATRMALDMKDVPAAYQVLTRDFIDALGITNIQEATTWSTNGGSIVDGNGQDVFNITFLANMRGVALSSGQQRNNYLSAGTLDSYALERYDISRGPNAALFSVGANTALGGGMGGQTKKARYDKPLETLAFTYGSWDYKRTTIDVNRPLTDRLAVRANAVWFDRGDWRLNGFEKTKGITVTGSYLLTPKTELRIEGAYDYTRRNNPQVNLFDNVSGWDGVTVLRGPITNAVWGDQTGALGATSASGARLSYNGEVQGVNRQGSPYYVWNAFSGQSAVMNYQFEGYTRRADETARTPMLANGTVISRNGNTAVLPFGNAGQTLRPPTPTATSNSGELDFRYQQVLPADRFNRALAGSYFRVPDKRYTNSLDTEILGQLTRDANFTLAHQIGDSLYLELGGDVNQVHDRRMNPNNLRNVRIDINQLLPNGAPNTHFLQPYMDTPLVWNNRFTTNSALRANAAWKKNAGKWGDYIFNLNVSANNRNVQNRNYVYSMASLADHRMWQGADEQIRTRYYWNDSARPYTDSGVPASVYRVSWVDPNAPVASTVAVAPRWTLGDWNDQDERFNNAILAISAKYFGGKLVLLSATRYDAFRTRTKARVEFGDLPVDWDGSARTYKPAAPADWRSLSYIPRNNTTGVATATKAIPAATRPRVNTTLPANTTNNGVQVPVSFFANDRFRNDYSPPDNKGDGLKISDGFVYHALPWVSFVGNYGSTYVPPPTNAFDLNNDVVMPQEGWGFDSGLRFTFFRGRLTVNANYFYNVEEHQRTDPPVKGSINGLLARNSADDGATDGRNVRGIPDVFGTDYQSQKNKGLELEVIGQIARGWRMMLNVGTGRVDTFDRWPLAKAFVLENADIYRQVLEDAGGRLDTTQKPSSAPHAPGLAVVNPAVTPAIAAERTNAINDYNNIWTNYELILGDVPFPGTNRLTANLFSDYTVQSGRFRGLRIGLGYQYRGRNFIGYRTADTIVSPTNPNLAIDDPDAGTNTPMYVKIPGIATATFGYTWRPKGWKRLDGKEVAFQLRIRNLFNNQQVVYQDEGVQARPPNGDFSKPNRVSVPVRIGQFTEPISFLFTTTLKL